MVGRGFQTEMFIYRSEKHHQSGFLVLGVRSFPEKQQSLLLCEIRPA